MSSYLAMGLAQGLKSGLSSYSQTKKDMASAKEREEEIAWRNEQREWQRSDRAQKEQLRTSLASAAAPAQVDQGTRVTDAAGSDAFTKDPDAAAMMGDMVAGQQPSLASATRVQGKTYTDREAAKKAEAEYNQPTARLDRMGDAAMGVDPQAGLSLKSAAATQRKQQFEMDKTMKAEANEKYNAELTTLVNSSPNWWEGAAEAISTSASLVLPPGSSVKPVLSADGKKVDMIAISPDGDEKVLKSFPADESGKELFFQQSMKADPMQQIKWLSERVKREYEQSKQQERHELTLAEIRARGDESRQTAGYRDSLRDGAAGGKAPSGYRWTKDGGMEFIPGGPADPSTKGVNINDLDKQQKELRTRLEQELISAGAVVPQMQEEALKKLAATASAGDAGAKAKLETIRSLQEQINLKGQQILGNAAAPSRMSLAGASATQSTPAIKALPEGAKQIGTSGGKPVYQLPNGRRVIAE